MAYMPSEAPRESDSLLSNESATKGPDRSHRRPRGLGRTSFCAIVSIGSVLIVLATALVGRLSDTTTSEPMRSRDIPLLGSSRKSDSNKVTCADGGYSKRTLKLAYELPFSSLFRDNKGQRKYEASSVIVVDDMAYAVCDSSWAISKFDSKLDPFADANIQVGDPARDKEDSGYEALFHDGGTFYVVRESIDHGRKSKRGGAAEQEVTGYHAVIEELSLQNDDYTVIEQCPTEFEFEGSSKGFEGATAVHDLSGELVVLGLCEGNHCSEKYKNDVGNGIVVAMRKTFDEHGHCQWETIRKIRVPKSANFRDYSALAVREGTSRVAISSQEESQMWVGTLLGRNEAGLWDVDRMEFDDSEGVVYDFPKNDNCETIYCNIEGVHWLNDDMVIAVSDKMKGRGKQDFVCFDKDQSVHVFVLPD